jgi:hypothetical protein
MQDPLAVTPADRQSMVTKILREFCATGHQILLVSSRPQHTRVYSRMGVPIADLSERESVKNPSEKESWDNDFVSSSTSQPANDLSTMR